MQQADNLTAARKLVGGGWGRGVGGLILQVSDHNFVADVACDKTGSLSGQKELQSEILCCSCLVSICHSGYGWVMSCVILCRPKKKTNLIENYLFFFLELASYNMADLYWNFGGTRTGGSRLLRNNCTCPLTLRRLMSYIYIYIYIYIYGAPILDVSRSHTTTQHSR